MLRGVAALSVVLWHWQHFFFTGTEPGTFEVAGLPLSSVLLPIYTRGWMAVDVFFCLSGFIFYWLYAEKVSSGSITPGRFALLRLSRLYPLHVATLVLVALGQFWLFSTRGGYFIYEHNDVKHFLLNLLFASSWGFETGFSFNGPIWSVSVEVLLYAIFFAICRLLPIRVTLLGLVSVIGFAVIRRHDPAIGSGVGSFFLGGCLFFLYRRIIASPRFQAVTRVLVAFVVGAWLLTFLVCLQGTNFAVSLLRDAPPVWRFVVNLSLDAWPTLVLFPATILTLALAETRRGTLGKRISFLGDISYSSYLLHFPLQLATYIVAGQLGLGTSIYYSPLFMIAFFAILILVSLGSYHYFEVPSQRFLRQFGVPAGLRASRTS